MSELPLNLIYLKYFSDAVQQGSISAAARFNHVSQSAISQAISKLEEASGHKLLDHCPNRFKVTDKGSLLVENAKSIFHALRQTEESLAEEGHGKIEFACTHSFALSLLPKYLQKAQKDYPYLQVNFRVAHPSNITEWVKKDMVDFGIISDSRNLNAFRPEEIFSFDYEEIYQGEYQLYISIHCEDVSCLGFLVGEETRETNLLKNAYMNQYGKELPVKMQVSSWQAIATLTEEGFGIGFLPDYVVQSRDHHLKLYPQKIVHVPYKLFAILPKNGRKSFKVMNFLKLLKAGF